MVTLITGWVFLISSWVAPYLTKEKQKGRYIGLILSLLATGIFIGGFLHKWFS